jgi:pimeloyl-ACP methyl ester carboxylesterase
VEPIIDADVFKIEPSRRRVTIPRNGVLLAGYLSLPSEGGVFACVTFIHGLGSSKDSPRNTVIAEALLDAGIAVLLFDLSGHGDSSPDPERRYLYDLAAAFRWLLDQPDVDSQRLGVAGSSLGATIAIDAVERGLIQPATMVLRAPPVGLLGLEPLTVPTLVLIGSADPLFASVQAAAEHSEYAHLFVVHGAGHLFEEEGALEEATKQTVNWFRDRLVEAG